MKLTAIAAVAASAAALVSATPLRVVVVSNSVQTTEPFPGPLRFGHPVGGSDAVAKLMPMNQPRPRPCGRFRQKAIDISNSFRKAFGFPLIEPDNVTHGKEIHGGVIRILPFIGGPTEARIERPMRNGKGWFGRTKGGERIQIITAATAGPAHDNVGAKLRPVKGYGYGHPGHLHHKDHPHRHGFHHRHGQDFYTRIQNAIMSLGPWEGRAVAFVLGCGLGVLLRMIWVLTVVTYRSIRGSDETEYVQVTVFDEDEEDQRRNTPISAPPAYVYPVDEKVELEAPKAAAPTANEN